MYTSSLAKLCSLPCWMRCLVGMIPCDSYLVISLMSKPTAKAIGIIAQPPTALASISNRSLPSPVHSTAGGLGTARFALPSRHAQADTRRVNPLNHADRLVVVAGLAVVDVPSAAVIRLPQRKATERAPSASPPARVHLLAGEPSCDGS